MSYNIDRAELNQASLDSISNAVFRIDNLDKVKDSFQRLIDNSDFTGDGATAIKDYLQNVHITLITTINVALQEFYAEFALYVAGFSDYDSYENALLNEDFFTEISNTLVGMIGLVDEVQPKAATAADNVSDLITDYSISSLSTYEQVLTDENNTITSLRDGIGEYDSNFATDVLSNIRALITDAQTLIDAIVNKGVVTIEQMEPQQYFTKDLVDNLQKDVQGAIDYINENSDEIQDSVKFVTDWYQKKIEEEREAARRARIEKGIILVGTAVIAIGSVIITAGSDTPAALVVVTSAAEAYVLVDSTAKLVEGIQDIYYGSTGDIETSSVNFLRDSLYGGDQDAYDLGSAIGAGALGATASLGTIMNAGAEATSIGASVEVAEISSAAEETFKAYAGLATDYAGEKIAESCSDDPLVQFVIQTTIGGVAGLYADEAAGALGDDIRVRATGHFDGSPSGYGPSVIDEMDDNNIIPDNVDSFETGTVRHCDADKYNLRTDLDDPNSFASRWSEEMREEKIFQESHQSKQQSTTTLEKVNEFDNAHIQELNSETGHINYEELFDEQREDIFSYNEEFADAIPQNENGLEKYLADNGYISTSKKSEIQSQFNDAFLERMESYGDDFDDSVCDSFMETSGIYAERAVKSGACKSADDYYSMYISRDYKYSSEFVEKVKEPYIKSGASSLVNQRDVKNAFDLERFGST